MKARRLGTTSFEISPIGLGCMQFAGPGIVQHMYRMLDQQTVTTIVRTALDGGITWFDTAEMYGKGTSERALTTALRDLDVQPGTVTIATKWTPLLRRASSITRTVTDRLTALQGYPVDLHQIHMPHGALSSIRAQVEAMARLHQAGTIGAVGVSNFSARQMEQAARTLQAYGTSLASNQVQVNLLRRAIERNGVLDAARRLGVTLIAFSPLAGGLLSGKFHHDPALLASVPRMRKLLGGFHARGLARTRPLVDELTAIARAYGVTASQVALSWLVTFYGATVVAIPGASKPHHAAEGAAAMDLHLTEKEIARLDELSRRCQ